MTESPSSTALESVDTEPRRFADAEMEQAFQSDRALLNTPAPSSKSSLLLPITLALFVFSQLGSQQQTVAGIAVLVGVLLFHELGHLAGMKLFGYRDVKMFFIPFFGAAVSGKRRGVAGWKEAAVLLLGPLPGIVLGLVVTVWDTVRPSEVLHSLALALVLINAFNLLPVSPLDGGRFFHLLFFSRHRVLEIAFASFAGLALIASFAFGMYLLPILGVLLLLGLPRQWRLRRAADSLRAQFAHWGGEPAELPEPQLRAAFVAARELNAGKSDRRSRAGADAIEQVVEHASLKPPSIIASIFLVIPWLGALIASFVALVLLSMSGPPSWERRDVPQGGFSILFPHPVPVGEVVRDTPFGELMMYSLDANGSAGIFVARWYDFPAGQRPASAEATAAFLDKSRDKLLERAEGELAEESNIPDGRRVRMTSNTSGDAIAEIRIVGERVYLLIAPVEPNDEVQRYFESFKLLPKEADRSTAR